MRLEVIGKMSNKLKKMFSNKEKKYLLNLEFSNADYYKKFVEQLEQIYETGDVMEVKGIDKVKMSIEENDSKYPIRRNNDITKTFIGPMSEEFIFPLDVDDYKGVIKLYRKILKEKIVINTGNDSVIDFKIELLLKDNKIQFKYDIKMERSVTVKQLIEDFKQFIAFIKLLFDKGQDIKERDRVLMFFNRGLHYLEHLFQLEKLFSVNFNTKLIGQDNNEIVLAEELYLMLVKNEKIRRNQRLNSITNARMESVKEGQEILLTVKTFKQCELFGEKLQFYEVGYFFNMTVKKIDPGENDEMTLYFTDVDIKPAFSAYSGFLDEDLAKHECENITEKVDIYNAAKQIGDHMKNI